MSSQAAFRSPPNANRDTPDTGDLASQIDIKKWIALFKRRFFLFMGVALAIFVIAIILTSRATPLYSATANVTINTRQTQVVDTKAVLAGLEADSSVVDTEVEILRSRHLSERVVDALELQDDPEFNGALRPPGPVSRLLGGISSLFGQAAPEQSRKKMDAVAEQRQREAVVDAVRGRLAINRAGVTYVMNVTFTSDNPTKAARIANAYAERYLLEQLETKFEATRQANDWLNVRLGELRAEVQAAEAAVAQYQSDNNLLSASGTTLTEQEISAYNQQLATVRAQQAEAEARLRTARSQLARGSTGGDVGEALGSTVVQRLREQRATVSRRVAELNQRYGPRHPDMLRAQDELRDIDGQIQAEIGRIVSNLEAQAQVARERTSSMAGSLGAARGTLATNTAAAVRLGELQRNAESVRTLYQSFLTRFQETSSQEGLEQSDARIVSRAAIPGGPSSPNVPLNLALGLMLGLGLGLAAVVLAELLDSGLMTGDEVERQFGLPSLGSVPALSSVATGADRDASPIDYLVRKPLSAFAEAVRALRTSVLYSRTGHDIKLVTITSALPGEGKTTTTLALARTSAQAGSRVLVIDCDLRRHNINRLLGFEPELGLLDVLNRTAPLEQVIHLDETSGAHVLPLARNSFTPKDVFGSPAMADLLQDVRSRYDLVLLDTAPALAISDTRILAARSDAVVFLARWRKTPRKAIQQALRLLEQAGAPVVGVVLTQVDMNAQASYGYGDAGYYYADYKRYYAG